MFPYTKSMNPTVAFFIMVVLLSLGELGVASGFESDISCLKALKDSVQDPNGKLSGWDFTAESICQFAGISCWNNDDSVLRIELCDMGLIGQFPAGLNNCSSLAVLNISGNQFSGPIPSDIGLILPPLSVLDLSNNQLSGPIPPSIAKCRFLSILRLDVNRLRGPIPDEIGLMPRLRNFSVSHNRLTGPVPVLPFITDVSQLGNNPGLCGYPLKACEIHSHNLPPFFRGFLTGWVVSTNLFFSVCLFAFRIIDVKKLYLQHTKKKNQKRGRQTRDEMNNTLRIAEMGRYATRISFAELSEATGRFSQDRLIGIGKTGATYKATIQEDGLFLAVKRLFHDDEYLDGQRIASEVLILSRLKHHRLVPLTGFCLHLNDVFLVYKYMKNGNLHDWLHLSRQEAEVEIMGYWPLRLKIAAGVADGLASLHQNGTLSVIHGAVISKCILLDEHFEPKISNFWEAKFITKLEDSLLAASILILQSPCDYEEFESDKKKDVYLFGIMLLEIITGKEPKELVSLMRNNASHPSSSSALPIHFELDEAIMDQGFEDDIMQCLELAKSCVQPNPGLRPSMVQVHATLAAFARGGLPIQMV